MSLLCIRTTLRYGFGPGLGGRCGGGDGRHRLRGVGDGSGAGALVAVEPVRWAMGAVGAVVLVVMGLRTLSAAQRVRLGLEVPSEVVTPPGRCARRWPPPRPTR